MSAHVQMKKSANFNPRFQSFRSYRNEKFNVGFLCLTFNKSFILLEKNRS